MAPTDEVAMVEMAEIEARDEALFTDDEDAVSINLVPNCCKRSRSLSPDKEAPSKKIKLDKILKEDFKCLYGVNGEPPFLLSQIMELSNNSNIILGLVWRKEHVETGDVIETCWRKINWITGHLNQFWDDYKRGHHQGKTIRFCPDGYLEIVDNTYGHAPGSFAHPTEYVVVYHKGGLYLDFGKEPLTDPQKGFKWLWLPESKMWIKTMKVLAGTFTYDELQYRQDCAKDSIMGSDN
ncbi:hypothetical protein H1R20_g8836, partial [Candolleomyces eurysporus]